MAARSIHVAGVIDLAEARLLIDCGVRHLEFPLVLDHHKEDLTTDEAAAIVAELDLTAILPPLRIQANWESTSMRMILKIKIPPESGNRAAQDGSMMKAFQSLNERLKPEATYFSMDDGMNVRRSFTKPTKKCNSLKYTNR
jgi:hypothetical protein